MDKQQRAAAVWKKLAARYDIPHHFLHHENEAQLLAAVILSAQCTDAQVNKCTPALFKRCKTARDFAEINQKELESLIHSCGFFRAKARNIRAAFRKIVTEYRGRVPDTMGALLTLPGVGRKTANIVLAACFGRQEGIAVDTHVFRVARRLGLSAGKTPERVEQDLLPLFPRSEYDRVSLGMIMHGRAVCHARNPECNRCVLAKLCTSAFKFPNFQNEVQ
ncbi:endonuclease III [Candidatus Micrarchaeota archaeon]|nr:endonuclease III [Candidatus Micrarchaeota archaeon]